MLLARAPVPGKHGVHRYGGGKRKARISQSVEEGLMQACGGRNRRRLQLTYEGLYHEQGNGVSLEETWYAQRVP